MSLEAEHSILRVRPAPALFAAAYLVHLLDEGLVAGSLPVWATQHGFHFTIEHWFVVSALSLILCVATVLLVSRGAWPSWVLLSIAVHLSLHALAHLGASAYWLSLSPGSVSGAIVSLPLAAWTARWAASNLSRSAIALGVAVGAASFQAPWDLAVRFALGFPIWVS